MRVDSIRARLTLTLTLATAALMLLVCGGLMTYTRHLAERGASDLLRATAEQIKADLNDGERHYAPLEVIEENQSRLQANNLALVIFNAQGRILQKSQQNVPLSTKPEADAWRVASVPGKDYTILVALPWGQTKDVLQSQALVLLALGLFVTLLSSVGAWWLVGRTLTPIHRLSRQANEASAENLHLRLSASSKDAEIIELVGTINALLERVAQVAASRSRFYAAASHELRTPLYVLAGSLEVALNRERSREEYREALQVADTQARQLTALTRDLLCLNQLDFLPTPPPDETVDLPDMLCHTLASFQALSESKRLKIETDLPPDGRLEAPPAHLEMLTRNLIENAIKYTPEGGSVLARMVVAANRVELIITNDYPPFPRLNCSQLFEPFYRPDASRNIHSGGNGLGLAICKAVAAANRWSLTLEQTEQGVCVKVLLGLQKAQIPPSETSPCLSSDIDV